jgi:hypothetical protein
VNAAAAMALKECQVPVGYPLYEEPDREDQDVLIVV